MHHAQSVISVACALNSTAQCNNKLHSVAELHMRINFLLLLQSQSITVDRQMRRYDVPRLAFINNVTGLALIPSGS